MIGIVKVTFTIQDADRDKGQVLYYTVVDPYFTMFGGQFLDAVAFYYQELAKRLDVLIMGQITAINISYDIALPVGIKTFPIITADVQEQAEFVYPRGSGSAYFAHRVPTFDHTVFGLNKEVSFQHTVALGYYTKLVFMSTDAPDWTGEYGVITDNRGVVVSNAPTVKKKWKPS